MGVPSGTAARKQVAGQMTVSISTASGSWKPVEMLGATWPGRGVVNQVEPGHSAPMGGTDEHGQETPPPIPPSPRRQLVRVMQQVQLPWGSHRAAL